METERTRDDNADSPNKAGNGGAWIGCLILFGLPLVALVVISYALGIIPSPVPLVKDRAMIAHFREHREEFEAVAQRFRSFPDRAREVGAAAPQDEVETKMLLERAGLNVTHPGWVDLRCVPWRPGNCALWLPDPYHPDSRRKARKLAQACRDEVEQWYDAKKASEKSEKDFEAEVPFPTCGQWNELRYGALAFFPTGKVKSSDNDFDYTTVTKRYIHFPEAPKIEDSRYGKSLRYPDPKHPEKTSGLQIVDSLNTFPLRGYGRSRSKARVGLYLCRYRPIKGEPHWFLEMCITDNTPGG